MFSAFCVGYQITIIPLSADVFIVHYNFHISFVISVGPLSGTVNQVYGFPIIQMRNWRPDWLQVYYPAFQSLAAKDESMHKEAHEQL